MGLSFLLRLFTRRPDGGLFDYLKRRDDNRTELELERERRVTSLEVIGQLGPGDEYQESTTAGWRKIRKAHVPPSTLLVLSETHGEQEQAGQQRTELFGQRARPIDQPKAPAQTQRLDLSDKHDDSAQQPGPP